MSFLLTRRGKRRGRGLTFVSNPFDVLVAEVAISGVNDFGFLLDGDGDGDGLRSLGCGGDRLREDRGLSRCGDDTEDVVLGVKVGPGGETGRTEIVAEQEV